MYAEGLFSADAKVSAGTSIICFLRPFFALTRRQLAVALLFPRDKVAMLQYARVAASTTLKISTAASLRYSALTRFERHSWCNFERTFL